MSEEELETLVDELYNDSSELYNYVSESVGDRKTDEEIDALVTDFQRSKLDLREFVLQTSEEDNE